jgi:hypothetical protein
VFFMTSQRVYELRDTERQLLVNKVNEWLEAELPGKPLKCIEVVQRRGRTSETLATLDPEELDLLGTGDALVDEVIAQFGQQGGKFELRATFQPEEGPGPQGVDRKVRHRSFQMTALRTEQRTVSQGASAGIEQLTTSFGSAFDSQGRQLTASVQQQTQLMAMMLDKSEKHHGTHIQEITEYQRLIMEQQLELCEAKIELAYREQSPLLTPEHLELVMPALVQLLTVLAGKFGAGDVVASVAGTAASAAVEGASTAPT